MNQIDKNFVFTTKKISNWFYNKYYYNGQNYRYFTFNAALNLLMQRSHNPLIIETGCQREKNDFSSGMSTSIWAEYISKYEGSLISIDINPKNLFMAKECIKEWDIDVTFICGDSIQVLSKIDKTPNLLYLDSYDYPFGKLLEIYGGREDLEKALIILENIPDEEIIKNYNNVIIPSQEHCLGEFKTIESNLDLSSTILLIDDNQLAGGGKPRLLKEYLLSKNWICLLDFQQSLWIKEK